MDDLPIEHGDLWMIYSEHGYKTNNIKMVKVVKKYRLLGNKGNWYMLPPGKLTVPWYRAVNPKS